MKYECNHCGEVIKNNGGSCREVGMLELHYFGLKREKTSVYYCYKCAKEIATELIDEAFR